MTTATLKKRQRKPRVRASRPVKGHDANLSAAFFMPAGSMTLDEFRQWTYSDNFPENGKIAYIGKEIFIDMYPERINSHASVATVICTTINTLVRKKNSGKFYFGRTRLANVAATFSNEPDALFACWESFKSGKIRMILTLDGKDYLELEGASDWVMEIVSPSSVTKDKKKLRKSYHRAGIGEYWLIDARGEDVDFQILIYGPEDYKPAQSVGDWQVSKVFGKKFRLRRIKDELGDVDYRLDVK
jgi:Uma2 family endonuclease